VEIARDLLDVEVVVAVEFVSGDRGEVRSGVGFDALTVGTVIPMPPGCQATYARETGLCVTGDLTSETRFVPSPFLIQADIRSSMTMAIELPDGEQAIIGAHSREPHRFAPSHVESFETLGSVFGFVIRRLRAWDELELNARIDPLTGLMNRASILDHLDQCFEDDEHPSALLIDIDGFKSVNDTLGHRSGDAVLRVIAQRIEAALSPRDRLGRLGGDEFLLITNDGESQRLAERLVGHVEAVIPIDSSTVQLSASVGIARRRPDDDALGMVERADRLMYKAKSAGRGEVRADLVKTEASSLTDSAPAGRSDRPTESQVDEAVAGVRIVVQPIIDPATQEIHGVEVLARGPVGHPLEYPDRLFEAATTFSRLGDLELEIKRLAFDLHLPDDVTLYINLEPVLLCSESWMERLSAAWASAGTTSPVTVELTERAVLQSPGRLLQAVEVCRAHGWKIALDDVGSRSEGLAALRWIDPDVVKLDMSLIASDNTAHSAHVMAAVAAYGDMDRHGSVQVIAEGVETIEDARYADVLGADLLQGYLFGSPGPVEDLFLTDHRHRHSQLPAPQRRDDDRIATKRELITMTRHVESTVQSSDSILIASMQHLDNISRQTRRQYAGLARRCGFVGIIAVDLGEFDGDRLRGVRLADIEPSDPMAANWQVVCMSPTASIGLLATEIEQETPPGDDLDRLFRYRIVTEPGDVEAAARTLLRYF